MPVALPVAMLRFLACHKHSTTFMLSPPNVLIHPNVVDSVLLISWGYGTSRLSTNDTV